MIVALNNVRSLHNVGSIFRSADGAGIEKIILGGLTPIPPRAEISKTALGATEAVAWEYTADLRARLIELKSEGYSLYALELTDRSRSVFEFSAPEKFVLVVGHEREGVEPSILEICDEHLEIPMRGKNAASLNVGIASAVAMYALMPKED